MSGWDVVGLFLVGWLLLDFVLLFALRQWRIHGPIRQTQKLGKGSVGIQAGGNIVQVAGDSSVQIVSARGSVAALSVGNVIMGGYRGGAKPEEGSTPPRPAAFTKAWDINDLPVTEFEALTMCPRCSDVASHRMRDRTPADPDEAAVIRVCNKCEQCWGQR